MSVPSTKICAKIQIHDSLILYKELFYNMKFQCHKNIFQKLLAYINIYFSYMMIFTMYIIQLKNLLRISGYQSHIMLQSFV